MVKIAPFVLVAAVPTLASVAGDNQLSAAALLKACTMPSMNWVDFCNGYLEAVHNYGVQLGEVCTPTGLKRTDLVKQFEQKVREMIKLDEAIAGMSGFVIAHRIIRAAYPCR